MYLTLFRSINYTFDWTFEHLINHDFCCNLKNKNKNNNNNPNNNNNNTNTEEQKPEEKENKVDGATAAGNEQNSGNNNNNNKQNAGAIVLGVYLHCEGCVKTVVKSLRGFEGDTLITIIIIILMINAH